MTTTANPSALSTWPSGFIVSPYLPQCNGHKTETTARQEQAQARLEVAVRVLECSRHGLRFVLPACQGSSERWSDPESRERESEESLLAHKDLIMRTRLAILVTRP